MCAERSSFPHAATPSLARCAKIQIVMNKKTGKGLLPLPVPDHISYISAAACASLQACGRSVQEILQPFAPRRMAELAKRLGLDLTDPFPCYIKFSSDLFKCTGPAVFQPEAEPYHLTLSFRQGAQCLIQFLLQAK